MGQEEVIPEKTVREQIRDQKRLIDRSKRGLEKERTHLEREKKKMLAEIKKLAFQGQHNAAKALARDIVRVTGQVNKLNEFIGHLSAVSLKMTSISSLNELSTAMEETGKAMTTVSGKLDMNKLSQMAKSMAKEDSKLEMKQEMISDVLDNLGDEMDDPEEQEKIYKQVLNEVGLKFDELLPVANEAAINKDANKDKVEEDSLDAMLKELKK